MDSAYRCFLHLRTMLYTNTEVFRLPACKLQYIYRTTTVMKVETEIITSITKSLISQSVDTENIACWDQKKN